MEKPTGVISNQILNQNTNWKTKLGVISHQIHNPETKWKNQLGAIYQITHIIQETGRLLAHQSTQIGHMFKCDR
jgi:hypothetical protein